MTLSRPPFWLCLLVGLVASPFVVLILMARLVQGAILHARTWAWLSSAHRGGLVCPDDHVRPLSTADRWRCPDCGAHFRGLAYAACPHCGTADRHGRPTTPRFVDCDLCGLAIAIPRIPTSLARLFADAGTAVPKAEEKRHG